MIYRILIFSVLLLSLVGCANLGKELKAFLKGSDVPDKSNSASSLLSSPKSDYIRYSDNSNIPFDEERDYRRMTKKEFEQVELRGDSDGSLWTMEGQDSYLFTENNVRMAGDLINVTLDGQPEKQLSTKAKVIKDLMKKIEEKRKMASQSKANTKTGEAETPEAGAAAAGKTDKKDAAAPAKTAEVDPEQEMDLGMDFDVKTVPSRIVEKMSDGNYRVKGSQNFMIGAKEYKVIVTGLVKPADVNNNSVDSSKILDSKFDIVRSIKR